MMTKKTNWLSNSPIVAAAFLMATSAIGPGFLTFEIFVDRSEE